MTDRAVEFPVHRDNDETDGGEVGEDRRLARVAQRVSNSTTVLMTS